MASSSRSKHRQHRPEDLVADDLAGRISVGHHRRAVVRADGKGATGNAAAQHPRGGPRPVDHPGNLLPVLHRNQRAKVGGRVVGRSDPHAGVQVGDAVDDIAVPRSVHNRPVAAVQSCPVLIRLPATAP